MQYDPWVHCPSCLCEHGRLIVATKETVDRLDVTNYSRGEEFIEGVRTLYCDEHAPADARPLTAVADEPLIVE